MAESTLSIDFNTLRQEVGSFIGWGRSQASYSADENTDFTLISARALRRFYFPPMQDGTPYYEWSFLRKQGQITLNTNTFAYDLPDDFGGTILDTSVVYNTAGVNQAPLAKISEDRIRKHRASGSQKKGYPKYYAVLNKDHAPTTGQRWRVLLYPTPALAQNTVVIDFRYAYVPNAISVTNKYPAGGAQYSHVILAAHLAEAEIYQDNDSQGVYNQQFQDLLTVALRNDDQQKQNSKGGFA